MKEKTQYFLHPYNGLVYRLKPGKGVFYWSTLNESWVESNTTYLQDYWTPITKAVAKYRRGKMSKKADKLTARLSATLWASIHAENWWCSGGETEEERNLVSGKAVDAIEAVEDYISELEEKIAEQKTELRYWSNR